MNEDRDLIFFKIAKHLIVARIVKTEAYALATAGGVHQFNAVTSHVNQCFYLRFKRNISVPILIMDHAESSYIYFFIVMLPIKNHEVIDD